MKILPKNRSPERTHTTLKIADLLRRIDAGGLYCGVQRGEIKLFDELKLKEEPNPTFEIQRNSVWSNKLKRDLIETIFLNRAIPSVLIWQPYGRELTYIYDGLQRIRTIYEFFTNNFYYSKKRVYFKDMDKDEQNIVMNYVLPITEYSPNEAIEVMREHFAKLNTTSIALFPQEIWYSQHSETPFWKMVESLSEYCRKLALDDEFNFFTNTQFARREDDYRVIRILFNFFHSEPTRNTRKNLEDFIGIMKIKSEPELRKYYMQPIRRGLRVFFKFLPSEKMMKKSWRTLTRNKVFFTEFIAFVSMLTDINKRPSYYLGEDDKNYCNEMNTKLCNLLKSKKFISTIEKDSQGQKSINQRRKLFELFFNDKIKRDSQRKFKAEQFRDYIEAHPEEYEKLEKKIKKTGDIVTLDHSKKSWYHGGKTVLENAKLLSGSENSRKGKGEN